MPALLFGGRLLVVAGAPSADSVIGTPAESGRMERFVRAVVAGGLALVAGLWTVTLSAAGSVPWLLGVALVALGSAGLAAGIGSEIEY